MKTSLNPIIALFFLLLASTGSATALTKRIDYSYVPPFGLRPSPMYDDNHSDPRFEFYFDLNCTTDRLAYGAIHNNYFADDDVGGPMNSPSSWKCDPKMKWPGPLNARSGQFIGADGVAVYGVSLGPWDNNGDPIPGKGQNIDKPTKCYGSQDGVMYWANYATTD